MSENNQNLLPPIKSIFYITSNNGANKYNHFEMLFNTIKNNKKASTIQRYLDREHTLRYGTCGFTLLHYAALYNTNHQVINLLMEYGSDIEATDKLIGATSILHAASMNTFSIFRTIFDFGCALDVTDMNGADILSYAAVNWEYGAQILSFLLQRGVNVHGWDNEGATPLAYAVRAHAHLDIVKALVGAGVNPATADINGVTPLLWAAANGDEDAVAYLLEQGADPYGKQEDSVKRLLAKSTEGIRFQ